MQRKDEGIQEGIEEESLEAAVSLEAVVPLEAEADGNIKKCYRKECGFCRPSVTQADGFIPTPPDRAKFWKILKDKGVNWTSNINPVHCKLHTEGPLNERALDRIRDQEDEGVVRLRNLKELLSEEERKASDAKSAEKVSKLYNQVQSCVAENAKLAGRGSHLKPKVDDYLVHLEQYKSCRKAVKNAEKNLKVGECLVYRDFVNQVRHHHITPLDY